MIEEFNDKDALIDYFSFFYGLYDPTTELFDCKPLRGTEIYFTTVCDDPRVHLLHNLATLAAN